MTEDRLHQVAVPGAVIAYVGLGSNLQQPLEQIHRARDELAAIPGNRDLVCSPLYGSEPVGPGQQPDYVNAVAGFSTVLSAQELLCECQAIELAHGRERSRRWGPRTLDLDLLLFGDEVIDTEELRVPHPELSRRPFVLYPLFDIAPDLEIPLFGPISVLIGRCAPKGVWRLD